MEIMMKSDFTLRTTINCNEAMLLDLKSRCKEKNLSSSAVIKKSLQLYLQDCKNIKNLWHTITYQQKGCKYKKHHFSMSGYEFDTYLDLKKFQRLSFSYIVALAIEKYADLILEGIAEDSYPPSGYTKLHIEKNNYSFFIQCWGIPKEPLTLEIFNE
jgi:hypothetical protein